MTHGLSYRTGSRRCSISTNFWDATTYTVNSLYTAVSRACERADVERFTPYDLRRTAATRVRATLGKEEAKLLLGHVSTDTTEIYLLDEVKETVKAAKRMEGS